MRSHVGTCLLWWFFAGFLLCAPAAVFAEPAEPEAPAETAVEVLARRLSEEGGGTAARKAAVRALFVIGDPAALPVLLEGLRENPTLLPELRVMIGMGRRAVRPLLEMLWARVLYEQSDVLLHLLNPDDVLEVCFGIMADYREAPAVRLRAGDHAMKLAGFKALNERQVELWKDLYTDPAATAELRAAMGGRIDGVETDTVDPTLQTAFGYRFLTPRTARYGVKTWFLAGGLFATMLKHLVSPTSPLAGDVAGFLSGIEVLKSPAGAVPTEIGRLLIEAANAPSPAVRKVAALFLPLVRRAGVAPLLRELAGDPDGEVRAAADRGLVLLNDPAGASEGASKGDLELGEEEIVARLKRIAAEKNPVLLESQLAELGRSGPETVGRLISHLTHPEYEIRAGAARALGATGSPRAVTPLLQAIGLEPDDSTGERALMEDAQVAAIEALGRLRSAAALSTLSRMYEPTLEETTLTALALAIARIGEKEALPLLAAAFTSDVQAFRRSAVVGFCELEYATVSEAVLELVRADSTRDEGLIILYSKAKKKKIGGGDLDEDLIEVLLELEEDGDSCTAILAGAILLELGLDEPYREIIDARNLEEIAARAPVFIMMGKEGSEDVLLEAFNDAPTAEMCIHFTDSSSLPLVKAGRAWAEENEKELRRAGPGPACRVEWGTTKIRIAGGMELTPR